MNAENHKTAMISGKRLLGWLLLVACLVGIPASLVFIAADRYYSVVEDELMFNLRMKLQQAASEAVLNTSQEEFWCRLFHEKFIEFSDRNASAAEIISWLDGQRKLFNHEFDFIFWDDKGQRLAQTFKSDYSAAEWQQVFFVMSSFGPFISSVPYAGKYHGDIEVVRKVLGPQFLREMCNGITDPRNYCLGWFDSSEIRPPVAAYFIKAGGVVILIDQKTFDRFSGLKHFIRDFAARNRIVLGTVDVSNRDYSIWQTDESVSAAELKPVFVDCEQRSLNFVELPDRYVGYLYLSPRLRIFGSSARRHTDDAIKLRALLAAGLYALLLLPFLRYTWLNMVRQQPGRASIRLKLAFLFLFASGIPLMAMAIISQEHYSHKRLTLMDDAHENSIETLLSFDRRYQSAIKDIGLDLDRFFADWSSRVRGKELDAALTEVIASHVRKLEIENFFMIASDSRVIGARAGFFHYRGSIDDITIIDAASPTRKLSNYVRDDMRTANLVGKKVMSDLNRVEIPGHTLSKLEIVAESLLQKSFIEITHSIIDSIGDINQWGFGYLKDMTYLKFISVAQSDVTDYLVMVFWRPQVMQNAFLKAALPQANRNPHGFKLIAYNRLLNRFVGKIPDQEGNLSEFARRLGQKPTEEIEILLVDGEEYLAVGFNGRYLEFFKVIGLYPLRNIESIIDEQKTDLILLGLFSILLAAGLAQLLTRSFVEPLTRIRHGALAIENRDFSHRIRDAESDEFGEVAGIFNNIMVGFEELEVARIVQESLFPKPDFVHNRFRIFGKSVSMGELGGDYLDFFKIDDDNFAVLMGDVAGHGVGAALIMAMAKAGILSSGDQLASPRTMLSQLHQMILASKNSRQKKVMTFQYLFMNSISCEGLYANAGACSPYVYRYSTGVIEELRQGGAALGAFKKAVYNEIPLALATGDAVIFYTDGIVESRDSAGQEIGYDGLQKLLCEAYDPDPAIYYQNIFNFYVRHIAGQDAQDDLTLIIMICTDSNQPV